MIQNSSNFIVAATIFVLTGCGGAPKTTKPVASQETKLAALQTLHDMLQLSPNAKVTSSTDIDWQAGVLPWDRVTLPVISPNGLHAIVQLGKTPAIAELCGNVNTQISNTTIELHALDPVQGRRIAPLVVGRNGLLLGRCANDQFALVSSPNGAQGRWIGKIDWNTGALRWVVTDDAINSFPTTNERGDIAWSSRTQDSDRFHLVVKTARGERTLDDGASDWLLPMFVGVDRLRAYQIIEGKLALVEFDLRAANPMQTSIALPILQSGATRAIVWQIATTNPLSAASSKHAFYHPIRKRMVIWQPTQAVETIALAPSSVAAAPVADGTWLVATANRVLRQNTAEEDGVHIRNQLAIPFATTSKKWTHLLLIPDGNRLQIRAINLSQ
jgi:hypothetical protein